MTSFRLLPLCLLLAAAPAATAATFKITAFGAKANDGRPDTAAIQEAIDAAAAEGAATGSNSVVVVPRGTFDTGALTLRSRVTFRLARTAVLKGSDDWRDYAKPGDADGDWQDALLSAEDAVNVRVVGSGVIDGSDCRRPAGEEGFRGPHAVRLVNVRNPKVAGVLIRGAGNYAVFAYGCRNLRVQNVDVRGGHDGAHVQNCDRVTLTDCDFRTGDDCLAGCDNTDAVIADCRFNSSTNGLRFGCFGLRMDRCDVWGPGEYPHQITGNTATQAAFVHFAPKDRNPELPSDDWQVTGLNVWGVRDLFNYDFHNGLWQQGRPIHALTIDGVDATVTNGVRVRPAPGFFLKIQNGTLRQSAGSGVPLIDVEDHRWVVLQNLTLEGRPGGPLVRLSGGQRQDVTNVRPAGRVAID